MRNHDNSLITQNTRTSVGLAIVTALLGVTAIYLLGGGASSSWLVAMVAVLPVLFVLTRGPMWALAAYVFCYALGLYSYAVAIGPVDLRPTDAAYVALLGWAWATRRRVGRVPRRNVGQKAWFALLAVILLSLYPVWATHTASITGPGIAWLRLFETMSVIWLLPYLVSGSADLQMLLRLFTTALAAEVFIALAAVALDGHLPERLLGPLDDPNAQGLVAALLLVLAVHAPLSWPPWHRWLFIIMALTALPLTRSIASMAAAAVTLAIFGLRATPSVMWQRETLIAPIRLFVLIAGLIGVVSILRGDNLPWSENYHNSDTPQRLILAEAAIRIYADQPVLGVGFSRSGSPEVVGDPGLNAILHRRYPDVPADRFPDINPSHVHNTYLQVLADSGTGGGICLVLVVAGTWRGVRRAVRQTGSDLDRRLARAVAAGLVVLVIWCNDNAIFGGQIETASIGLLVGCIAASRPRWQPPDEQVAPATRLLAEAAK